MPVRRCRPLDRRCSSELETCVDVGACTIDDPFEDPAGFSQQLRGKVGVFGISGQLVEEREDPDSPPRALVLRGDDRRVVGRKHHRVGGDEEDALLVQVTSGEAITGGEPLKRRFVQHLSGTGFSGPHEALTAEGDEVLVTGLPLHQRIRDKSPGIARKN